MASRPSEYPERIRSSGEEGHWRHLAERVGSGGVSKGWLIAGLAVVGIGAWAAWHFGPDLARYMKMERM
ncbi:MAG TPA: hypothetical protein VN688_30635 [Gemmataceae bacterium]|nr:hypothetical protein [Gemmataceae bacterium]